MCVIMLMETGVRPTEDQVRAGYVENPHGGGAAWRTSDGKVKFTKGLDLEEMVELNKTLPFPYVLHCRKPSLNTALGPEACHPFPVTDDVSYELTGETDRGVLFHNGHWSGWKEELLKTAINGYRQLPGGPWSDTRGLAWMTSHIGPGFLEMVDQKVVFLLPDVVHMFGSGWSYINKNDKGGGIWVSNLTWQKTGGQRQANFTQGQHSHQKTHETGPKQQTERTGGFSRDVTFRGPNGGGDRSGERTHQQERVQEGDASADSWVAEQSRKHPDRQEAATEEGLGRLVTAGRDLCMDCAAKPGKIVRRNSAGADILRCWACWWSFRELHGEGNTSGEAFMQGPGTALVHIPRQEVADNDRCSFCKTYHTVYRLSDGEHLPICATCWLKNGKPDVELASTGLPAQMNHDLAKKAEDAARGITTNHLG